MKKNLRLHRILSLTTLLFFLFGGGYKAMAQKVNIDGIYYTLSGSGENAYATVTDNGTTAPGTYSGDVVIPNTVSYNDITYKVTHIGGQSFKNSTGLTSVTIPANVTNLGNKAFDGCTSLSVINFNATAMTSAGGTSNYSYNGCTHSCIVNIGEGVTSLPNYAFAGLTNISAINFNADNCGDASGTYHYIWTSSTSAPCVLTIGNNVTRVPAYLFRLYTGITTVNMGNSVEAIGEQAFYFTSKNSTLSGNISLPETLNTIGTKAFYNCSGVTFNWPSGITSIGESAFFYCENLTNVAINDAITEIPASTFQGCTGLTTLTIGTGVKTIGNSAFSGCTGLTNITLNATLTTVPTSSSYYAFKNCTCTNVCTLTIGTGVTSIPNGTFGGLSNVGTINFNATSCADFTSSSSYIMPSTPTVGFELYFGDNVTRIPAYLFNTKTINHITIGSSVASIGARALYNTSSTYPINVIISKPTTPPTIASDSFYTNTRSCPVYVPVGKKSSYQAATNWSSFTNFKEFAEITEHIDNDGTMLVEIDALLLTGDGAITIKNGGKVISPNIFGATPENLIIEDGGQLILGDDANVQATVEKEIEAAQQAKDDIPAFGWYTISSPINNIAISSVTDLNSNEYDLYRYDEESVMWENYKSTEPVHYGFSVSDNNSKLENGRGYLYRNSGDVELQFTGNINVGDVVYPLSYNDMNELDGIHLIGNPYPHSITKGVDKAIDNNILSVGFYTLNMDQNAWIVHKDGEEIKAMQGFLVQTTEELTEFTIKDINYVAPTKSHSNNIRFTVESSEYSDIAYAMFDKGYGLNKIDHRNADIQKLYINYDGENYALAMMNDDTKVINLNFEAKTMGKYTLSLKANGNFSYLHLIDKLTGEDVDMLIEDEYSFIGSPSDNAERFIVRLEYSDGSEILESFAYQNGSDIVVTGEGELQIFDVMGRMVKTQCINGVETVNVPTDGVYIFRLNEKVQKIVVK